MTSASGPAATTAPSRRIERRARTRAGSPRRDATRGRSRPVTVRRPGRQVAQQGLAGAQVQAGGRFVEEQQVRIGHERPGDRRPPPLARRQRRERVVHDGAQAEALRQLAGPRPIGVRVVVPPRLGSRVAGGHDQVRRASGRRGTSPRWRCRPSPIRRRCSRTSTRPYRSPSTSTRPVVGHRLRPDDGHERGLAGSVGAQDDPSLAGPDAPIERAQDGPPARAGRRRPRGR